MPTTVEILDDEAALVLGPETLAVYISGNDDEMAGVSEVIISSIAVLIQAGDDWIEEAVRRASVKYDKIMKEVQSALDEEE